MVKFVLKRYKNVNASKNTLCDNCPNLIPKGKRLKAYNEKGIYTKLCIYCYDSLILEASMQNIKEIKDKLDSE